MAVNVTKDQLLALIMSLQDDVDALSSIASQAGIDPALVTKINNSETKLNNMLTQMQTYLSGSTVSTYAQQAITSTTSVADILVGLLRSLEYVRADVVNAETVIANDVEADVLDALDAEIQNLDARYVQADSIVSDTMTVSQLFGYMAQFLNLVCTNVSASAVNAFTIGSDHLTINNGYITNAMIASLSASKISAGTLNLTQGINITSADTAGSVSFDSSGINMYNGQRLKLQVGKDATGNYNFVLYDDNGNALWNALGIQASAFKSAIIKDSMIASDASIAASKLDLPGLITALDEDGTLKTTASELIVDASTGVALSSWISTMTSRIAADETVQSTHTTQLTQLENNIALKVSSSDFNTYQANQTTLYQSLSDDVAALQLDADSLTTTVQSHTSTMNALNSDLTSLRTTTNNSITTLQQTSDALELSVQTVESDVDDLDSEVTRLGRNFQFTSNGIRIYDTTSNNAASITIGGTNNDKIIIDANQSNGAAKARVTLSSSGLSIESGTQAINLSSDGIVISDNDTELGKWDGDVFHCHNIQVDATEYAQFGNFKFTPDASGNLVLRKVSTT